MASRRRPVCCSRPVLASAGCCLAGLTLLYWLSAGSGSSSSPSAADESGRHGPAAAAVGGTLNFNQSLAVSLLRSLCVQYKAGRLSGDLCNRLCYQDSFDVLDLQQSTKVVIQLAVGGQKLVLKSQRLLFEEAIADGVPPADVFERRVLELTNEHLELGWPVAQKQHLIRMLWPLATTAGGNGKQGQLSAADRRSLWSLVGQDEFLTFRVLPLARVFPKVLGSCGHFYAVEYLVPFKLKSYYTNLKAKILVHLMGTLKLFYEFLNEPLQWCDVKFDNFGLSADYPKRFMVMDADMLYTKSRVGRLFGSKECKSDEDCRLLDCTASCDRERGRCAERRLNDNVDVFCEKLVKQLFGTFWTKSNRYLSACHDTSANRTQRLQELRVVWAWSLPDV